MESTIRKVAKAINSLMNERIDEYIKVYFGNDQYKDIILDDLQRQISWMAEDLGLPRSYFKKNVLERVKRIQYDNDCILERNYLSNLSVHAKPFVPPLPSQPPIMKIVDKRKNDDDTFDTSYLDSLLRLD